MNITLNCVRCRRSYEATTLIYKCDCGGTLDVIHDLESLKKINLKEMFESRLSSKALPYSSGVWRYRELVLPIGEGEIISRIEGNTNLYASDRISEFTGVKNILVKHEGENPTGSFKDRGMTVGITMAKHYGYENVACASTGNTSASMASYAATCGMNAIVLIPEGEIASGKLAQAIAYGGRILQVGGDFDLAMNLVTEIASRMKIYLLNSINPFRIEGQKTIIFEALQQMEWEVPDWVILPGGNLGNSSAIGKGIEELYQLGVITKKPRIAVIQAAGANPFFSYFNNDYQEFVPVEAHTMATAIKIGNPVSYDKCRRAIQLTDGFVEELTEEEILESKAIVDSSGIGAEPASCCSVGGVRKLVMEGIINAKDKVLAILTGNMMKDPDSIVHSHIGDLPLPDEYRNMPAKVKSTFEDILSSIRGTRD